MEDLKGSQHGSIGAEAISCLVFESHVMHTMRDKRLPLPIGGMILSYSSPSYLLKLQPSNPAHSSDLRQMAHACLRINTEQERYHVSNQVGGAIVNELALGSANWAAYMIEAFNCQRHESRTTHMHFVNQCIQDTHMCRHVDLSLY